MFSSPFLAFRGPAAFLPFSRAISLYAFNTQPFKTCLITALPSQLVNCRIADLFIHKSNLFRLDWQGNNVRVFISARSWVSFFFVGVVRTGLLE